MSSRHLPRLIYLLPLFLIIVSTITIIFSSYHPSSPSPDLNTYSNSDFSFQYPLGWILSKPVSQSCGSTQSITDPHSSETISIIPRCNYNQMTGLPFRSLEQYLGERYTFYTYSIRNGVNIAVSFNMNSELSPPSEISFIATPKSTIYIIDFQPTNIKLSTFNTVLSSLQFHNIPTPSPTPSPDPTTHLRNLVLHKLQFSLPSDWQFEYGQNGWLPTDWYKINPISMSGNKSGLWAFELTVETKNQPNLEQEKSSFLNTHLFQRLTNTKSLSVSGTKGYLLTTKVGPPPSGVTCPECYLSPYHENEVVQVALFVNESDVYTLSHGSDNLESEFDQILSTFKFINTSSLPTGINSNQLSVKQKIGNSYFTKFLKSSMNFNIDSSVQRSGVLISDENSSDFKIYYEIHDTITNSSNKNNPVDFWQEGNDFYTTIVDTNGAGSGEGQAKLVRINPLTKKWDVIYCFYYSPENYTAAAQLKSSGISLSQAIMKYYGSNSNDSSCTNFALSF